MIHRRLDPITREIINNSLCSSADTMAVTVMRTARSAVVKDGMDFSTAIFVPGGQQVAQGLTQPFHMGAMEPALRSIMEKFKNNVRPGDIFANNDPYEGASHLPDIFLFKPVFAGELAGWTCVIAHHTDIGGRVAGGNACDSTEIYQEGLRLPPLKLFEEGRLNQAIWDIIGKNVRVPDMVFGDLRAQISALGQGERDLMALIKAHGRDRLQTYLRDILDHTERLTRAEISALPEGTWEFTDFIDDDGIDPDPIAIQVSVTIDGGKVLVDFTGTSPQVKGSINPNFAFTKSSVYAAFKCLTNGEIPANSGFFRPFRILAPEGCFVNPRHPAAVAARGLGGFRIAHAVLGAMAKALPDRVSGAWGGGEIGVSIGGYLPGGKAFVHLEFNNDGPRGGGPLQDGCEGAASPVSNMANTPIETIESAQPLLVRGYGFVPDTGGPGKYRGGLGMVREFQILAEEAMVQIRSDRTRYAPWGVCGGKPGTKTRITLNPDSEDRVLPSKFLLELKRDDVVRLVQAGGGGYSDPLEREPERVLEDFRQGKVTCRHARRNYGVVIDREAKEIDQLATGELRQKMKDELQAG